MITSASIRFSRRGARWFAFWLLAVALFVGGWAWRPYTPPPEVTATASGQPGGTEYSGAFGVFYRRVLDRNDSWMAMNLALTQVSEHPHEPLYATVMKREKFQYPPSSLLPLDLMRASFGPGATANWVLSGIGLLSFPFLLWAVFQLCRPALPDPRAALLDSALPILFTATCYPVLKAFELGQIQSYLNALFCLATLAFLRGSTIAAGVMLGIMASIKPQMAMFLPWAFIQREHRFGKAMGVTLVTLELAALLRYGLAPHLEYVGVLQHISRHGESYCANQSLNGLILRALHLGPNLQFDNHSFAPESPWVRFPTLISGLAFMAMGLWRRAKIPRVRGLDFVFAALCFTLGSPVAWEHHYGIVPAAFALCFVAISELGFQRRGAIVLGVAWLLIGTRVAAVAALADTSLNFLQSYIYFGGLLLLATVHSLSSRLARTDAKIRAGSSSATS